MTITNSDAQRRFNGNPAASPEAIRDFEESTGLKLPTDYKELLRRTNGGEGFIGEESYLILWKVEDLEEFNREYEVGDYCNGLLLVGSRGGGEAYGFDTRQTQWPVVQVPFVGMDHSLVQDIGWSFKEFLTTLEQMKGSA